MKELALDFILAKHNEIEEVVRKWNSSLGPNRAQLVPWSLFQDALNEAFQRGQAAEVQPAEVQEEEDFDLFQVYWVCDDEKARVLEIVEKAQAADPDEPEVGLDGKWTQEEVALLKAIFPNIAFYVKA